MHDTHDPFSFLLSEIQAHDAGDRTTWDGELRAHFLDVLLVEEAQEIAWGRRHLTVIHGEALDEIEAELLDDVFAAWEDIAADADWARIGGVPDHHLTLTVAGTAVDERLALAADVAVRANPGHWLIVDGAAPRPA